jgi:hypothetical protein
MAASIRFEEQRAVAKLVYKGRPAEGLLAWIDNERVTDWWQLDFVDIDPEPGGVYFLGWGGNGMDMPSMAVYGVVSLVDAEDNTFLVKHIYYNTPDGKLGPIDMKIHVTDKGDGFSELTLEQQHNFAGQMKEQYEQYVTQDWPKVFHLLEKYLASPGVFKDK